MKTSIQQMTKFLERKETGAKYFLGKPDEADQFWLRASLSTIRMALTEARRLEHEEGARATGGGAKKAARPKR